MANILCSFRKVEARHNSRLIFKTIHLLVGEVLLLSLSTWRPFSHELKQLKPFHPSLNCHRNNAKALSTVSGKLRGCNLSWDVGDVGCWMCPSGPSEQHTVVLNKRAAQQTDICTESEQTERAANFLWEIKNEHPSFCFCVCACVCVSWYALWKKTELGHWFNFNFFPLNCT